MPPKTIYTTERPNRDFSWFSPARPSPPPETIDLSLPPSPPTPSPRKPSRPTPTTPRRVHKTPSTMFSITPKPSRRSGTRPKDPPRIVLQPPPDEPPSTKPGPWSDWFPTRDSPPRFWRARKLADGMSPPLPKSTHPLTHTC